MTHNTVNAFAIFRALLLITAILCMAGLALVWIDASEPVVQREGAERKTAMLVDVVAVQRDDYIPRIQVLGTVTPSRDIVLSPQVSGQVTEISTQFLPGSVLKAGQEVLKIEDADYRNTLKKLESAYQSAKSELALELGRVDVAKKEYALLNKDISQKHRALVLRDPQKSAAAAAVQAAKADLDQATLELHRTSVKAPFDAQVLSRNVNVGSQVDAGSQLARLVDIKEYWVIATLPVAKLAQLDLPSEGKAGANAIIRAPRVWPSGSVRQGKVISLMGTLEENTRMARLIIRVSDPLALKSKELPPLLLGSMVQTEISGKKLKNVFRIPREYLHEGDTVWLNRDNKLHIATTKVVLKDKQYAYILDGIAANDLLITSSLATVAEGIALRVDATTDGQAAAEREQP